MAERIESHASMCVGRTSKGDSRSMFRTQGHRDFGSRAGAHTHATRVSGNAAPQRLYLRTLPIPRWGRSRASSHLKPCGNDGLRMTRHKLLFEVTETVTGHCRREPECAPDLPHRCFRKTNGQRTLSGTLALAR